MNRTRDRSSGPTTSQLRHQIDEGRQGDKVAAEDPSAAPLGTDDEAAGQPPGPEQVEQAMEPARSRRRSTMLPWTLAVLAALMTTVVVLALV